MRTCLALCSTLLIAGVATADVAPGEFASPARRPLKTGVPVYPKKARDRRLEGEVVVCYTIDSQGRVRKPYVEKSSHRFFNKSALRAIRETRYEAAAPGATNARSTACNTYSYVLTPLETEATSDGQK